MSDLNKLTDRIANTIKEAPPEGEYAVSEKELRRLARKELTEAEKGTTVGAESDTFLVRKAESGKVVVTSKRSGRDVFTGEPYVARALADALEKAADR